MFVKVKLNLKMHLTLHQLNTYRHAISKCDYVSLDRWRYISCKYASIKYPLKKVEVKLLFMCLIAVGNFSMSMNVALCYFFSFMYLWVCFFESAEGKKCNRCYYVCTENYTFSFFLNILWFMMIINIWVIPWM